jgi:hypothetical protein
MSRFPSIYIHRAVRAAVEIELLKQDGSFAPVETLLRDWLKRRH